MRDLTEDPLPETPEACDAEIAALLDECDHIAAQIEGFDAGLVLHDDPHWRRRVADAWVHLQREKRGIRRHRDRMVCPPGHEQQQAAETLIGIIKERHPETWPDAQEALRAVRERVRAERGPRPASLSLGSS